MKKIKRLMATLLAVAMLVSIGTSVMAADVETSEVDKNGNKPVSQRVDVTPQTRSTPDVNFVHESWFEYDTHGSSGNPDDRVCGKTSHYYVVSGQAALGYTRARFESGSRFEGDSERQYGTGHSSAKSGYRPTFGIWIGHTYYGH